MMGGKGTPAGQAGEGPAPPKTRRGQSPEYLAELRRRKLDKAAGLLAAPTIDDLLPEFPQFQEASWFAWRVFMRCLDGLPLDAAELAVFQARTGRTAPPTKPVREAYVVVGRRGRNEETAANPDSEVLAALKPGLLTSGGPLVVISSPYAQGWPLCCATYWRRLLGLSGASPAASRTKPRKHNLAPPFWKHKAASAAK